MSENQWEVVPIILGNSEARHLDLSDPTAFCYATFSRSLRGVADLQIGNRFENDAP